jgi:hypothetical protein
MDRFALEPGECIDSGIAQLEVERIGTAVCKLEYRYSLFLSAFDHHASPVRACVTGLLLRLCNQHTVSAACSRALERRRIP